MTTQIEQASSDLLHFSEKFKVKKIKLSDGTQKKTSSRDTRDKKWNIKSSEFAMKTHNPIRAIVDGLKIEPNPMKPMIALSIGKFFLFYDSIKTRIKKLRERFIR